MSTTTAESKVLSAAIAYFKAKNAEVPDEQTVKNAETDLLNATETLMHFKKIRFNS